MIKVRPYIFYAVITGLLLTLNACGGVGHQKERVSTDYFIPKMVSIPAGEINTSACPSGVNVCPYHDYEERLLKINAFEVSATEITFAQWDACVDDGGCVNPKSSWAYKNRPIVPPCVEGEVCQYPNDKGWGRGERPVINVSWNDVQQYLTWLNKKTGEHFRLLRTEEWEYVAIAGTSTRYHWGESLGSNHANCNGCGSQWDGKQTAPVASFKANPFGVYDMLGNVSEWVSSCFPTREKGSQACGSHIYRGGAWSYQAANGEAIDPRNFNDYYASMRAPYVGFRIAR